MIGPRILDYLKWVQSGHIFLDVEVPNIQGVISMNFLRLSTLSPISVEKIYSHSTRIFQTNLKQRTLSGSSSFPKAARRSFHPAPCSAGPALRACLPLT